MADVKVKLRIKGLNALMTSPPVVSIVAQRAARIAKAAGPDFEMVVKPTNRVARAFVRSKGAAGAKAEARNKVLTMALDAGR